MDFLAQVLKFLDAPMSVPVPYGAFHIISLVLTLGAAVFVSLMHRKKAQNVRAVVLFITVATLLLEVYKQINFSTSYENGITWDYPWYIFPFQFCSTPMYAGLLMGLTKRGKLHNVAAAYLATYALFAGLAVMLYPTTVFVDTIGINFQTMFCHGSMIFVGIYLLATGYVPLEHKTILRAAPLFLAFVAVAAALNEAAYRTGLLETEGFNMFFISPYQDPHLPVYSIAQQYVPFPWCVLLYVLGFTAASYIVLLISMLIGKLIKKPVSAPKEKELINA